MQPLTGRDVMAMSDGRARDIADQVDAMNEQMRRLQSRIAELSAAEVTGTSTQGTVTATVTGMGRLRTVAISPYAMRDLNNVQLGTAACEAIQDARLNAAKALQEALAESTGSQPPEDLAPVGDPIAALREAINS
jgi:DNA-binding protein YbaB